MAAVLAVLSGAFRSLNEARFQDFLECVGKPLGCDDFEAASTDRLKTSASARAAGRATQHWAIVRRW